MTAKWAAPCALLLVMAGVTWFLLPERLTGRILDGMRDGPELDEGDRGERLADPARADADAKPGETALAERLAIPASGGIEAPPPSDLPPSGLVSFAIVDASGRTIDDVRVRFQAEKRFAEYSGGGEGSARLTIGEWEGSVMAIGCEPTRLASFEVKAGETTQLAPVVLTHGSGVVEGRVIARHLGADVPLQVELHGDGRAPCDLCRPRPDVEAPSPCECGFGSERNELALTDRRGFRFGHLAAGVYWLRAFTLEQRIVASRRIELARGGSVWQEIDVTEPTSARFELRHDSESALGRGGLFTGDWSSVHRESPAPICFSFKWDGKDVGAQIDPTRDDVRASIGVPVLALGDANDPADVELANVWFREGADWSEVVSSHLVQRISINFNDVLVQRMGDLVFAPGGGDDRLDRERTDADSLEFESGEPGITGASLTVERLRPDLFRVKPLPRELLTVVVTCGNYSSDELPLDLRFEQFAPLVVTMRPSQEWCEQVKAIHLRAPNACTSCHGENGELSKPEFLTTFVIGEGGIVQGEIRLDLGQGLIVAPGAEPAGDASGAESSDER